MVEKSNIWLIRTVDEMMTATLKKLFAITMVASSFFGFSMSFSSPEYLELLSVFIVLISFGESEKIAVSEPDTNAPIAIKQAIPSKAKA
jgi:hypothetical protein